LEKADYPVANRSNYHQREWGSGAKKWLPGQIQIRGDWVIARGTASEIAKSTRNWDRVQLRYAMLGENGIVKNVANLELLVDKTCVSPLREDETMH
jgi:hypothetical protein